MGKGTLGVAARVLLTIGSVTIILGACLSVIGEHTYGLAILSIGISAQVLAVVYQVLVNQREEKRDE